MPAVYFVLFLDFRNQFQAGIIKLQAVVNTIEITPTIKIIQNKTVVEKAFQNEIIFAIFPQLMT